MNRYLIIPLASLLLTCCSADQVEQQAGDTADTVPQEVNYTVSMDITRAPIADTEEFIQEGRQFRVWAFMDNGLNNGGDCNDPMISDFVSDPLQNVLVTYSQARNSWETSETYYWPRPKYNVNFYAVYPENAGYNAETKALNYSSAVGLAQADVMYATYSGKRTGTKDEKKLGKTVPLVFHHPFSLVQFQAKKSNELTVTINSLEIHNVYSTGTFTLPTPVLNSTDVQLGSWDNLGGQITYSVSLSSPISLTGELQSLDNNVLVVIPQTNAAWDVTHATNKVITNNDGASGPKGSYLKIGCSVVFGGTNYADNGFIYVPFALNWEAGKRYIYKLGFGSGYNHEGVKTIQEITLSVTVTDWVNGGSETSDGTIFI